MINHHLIPDLGSNQIGNPDPVSLKAYTKKQKGGRADGKPGGLSNRSVQYMHMVLKADPSNMDKYFGKR